MSRAFVRDKLDGSLGGDDAERGRQSRFTVTVTMCGGWARIVVTDAIGRGARLDDDEEYGRGLLLVESSGVKIGHDVGGGHRLSVRLAARRLRR
ncbi:hypothetical protein [Spirillospora sp. CA-294931]|uniref:hypothetical protein n=1 Tax=Spirillospora sp. CA-294931 TaxID=3240042 RepID=UPI003D8B4C7D